MLTNISKRIPFPVVVGSTLVGTFGLACIVKDFLGGQRYEGLGNKNIENKVVIVTGANTGIGKETAWELAKRGAKVYMACRDLKRCEIARKEIVLDTKNMYVYCRQCDLSSLISIKEFVNSFKSHEERLDVLINNAGIMNVPSSKTKEGFEMHLGVNHMGHFLLTNLLLDMLKKSAPSRIINVSSVAHKKGKINKQDLNCEQNYNAYEAYAQSKLANMLFTKELAERLKDSGITVNAVHPGLVDTELWRYTSFYKSWLATAILKPFIWPFIKGPKQGAQTIIYLAIDDSLQDITGKYFSDFKEVDVSSEANDEATAKWLWAVSEKWTRLNETL